MESLRKIILKIVTFGRKKTLSQYISRLPAERQEFWNQPAYKGYAYHPEFIRMILHRYLLSPVVRHSLWIAAGYLLARIVG